MEEMELLRQIFFLKDLSTGELIKLNILAEKASFKEGETIAEEGSPGDCIYIIRAGSVRVMKGATHVHTLNAGEPVGEMSFMDRSPRSATLVAASDVALICISAEHLEKVLELDKALAYKIHRSIIAFLSKRLREANECLKIVPDYIRNLTGEN